jgi:hypothetical protein
MELVVTRLDAIRPISNSEGFSLDRIAYRIIYSP